mmetsp:Transcript_6824/g.29983  ORF Transcript_6824/g.29983 Transcript_6824/m.29983 type:complete len:309 (-) Transcript_6824:671-1597(-)
MRSLFAPLKPPSSLTTSVLAELANRRLDDGTLELARETLVVVGHVGASLLAAAHPHPVVQPRERGVPKRETLLRARHHHDVDHQQVHVVELIPRDAQPQVPAQIAALTAEVVQERRVVVVGGDVHRPELAAHPGDDLVSLVILALERAREVRLAVLPVPKPAVRALAPRPLNAHGLAALVPAAPVQRRVLARDLHRKLRNPLLERLLRVLAQTRRQAVAGRTRVDRHGVHRVRPELVVPGFGLEVQPRPGVRRLRVPRIVVIPRRERRGEAHRLQRLRPAPRVPSQVIPKRLETLKRVPVGFRDDRLR